MTDPSTLIQPHAETIVATLALALDSPDPPARLRAAKLLLRLAWGPADGKGIGAEPAGGSRHAEQQRAVERLLSQAGPDPEVANPAATSCPARHAADAAAPAKDTPHAETAINPMSPEPPPPQPLPPPSPLAAPPGTDSPRRDADPMSRQLLPDRHSADSSFRRPLPPPPDMEPPWPFQHEGTRPAYRRQRWPPWR